MTAATRSGDAPMMIDWVEESAMGEATRPPPGRSRSTPADGVPPAGRATSWQTHRGVRVGFDRADQAGPRR
ncbi:hypothetical protein V2I01_02655 [Micromonospora sp. BRA006-A]|nr:hypothetical protein [Micromonospora sp. BRA006-A]